MKPIILQTKPGRNGKGGITGLLAFYQCNECSNKWWEGISQKKLFCSKKCYRKNQLQRTKQQAVRWKGGKVIQQGYWCIKQDDGSYKKEHRLIMEKHLGRKLNKGEDVHHINADKLDNRIENLVLMNSSDHHKEHYKYIEIDPKTKRFIKSHYLEKFI